MDREPTVLVELPLDRQSAMVGPPKVIAFPSIQAPAVIGVGWAGFVSSLGLAFCIKGLIRLALLFFPVDFEEQPEESYKVLAPLWSKVPVIPALAIVF